MRTSYSVISQCLVLLNSYCSNKLNVASTSLSPWLEMITNLFAFHWRLSADARRPDTGGLYYLQRQLASHETSAFTVKRSGWNGKRHKKFKKAQEIVARNDSMLEKESKPLNIPGTKHACSFSTDKHRHNCLSKAAVQPGVQNMWELRAHEINKTSVFSIKSFQRSKYLQEDDSVFKKKRKFFKLAGGSRGGVNGSLIFRKCLFEGKPLVKTAPAIHLYICTSSFRF